MNIKRAIYSSNQNKDYSEFEIITKKTWNSINFLSTHIKVNRNIISLKEKNLFLEFNFNDEAFLAKCIRLFIPYFFQKDFCYLSDIDIIPLNRDYFTNDIDFNSNNFYIFRANKIINSQIPICWNSAKGVVWSEIFNISSENKIVKTINNWHSESKNSSYLNTYYDQLMLNQYLKTYKEKFPKRIVYLDDEQKHFSRLDRKNYKNTSKMIISNHKFSDFHMPRPYSRYKLLINLIKNSYLSNKLFLRLIFRILSFFYILFIKFSPWNRS